MHIRRLNEPLFELDEEHPAREFLEAFIECRRLCIGQELPLPFGNGLDQRWWSSIDNKEWTFSGFAYAYLAVDVVLDGWLSSVPYLTESEKLAIERLPRVIALVTECQDAAKADGNDAVLQLAEIAEKALSHWKRCIESRV